MKATLARMLRPSLLSFAVLLSSAPKVNAAQNYRVHLRGPLNREMRSALLAVTETWVYRRRPPPTLTALERRVQRDRRAMLDWLRSEGWFDGRVSARLERRKRRVAVLFQVEPGPTYRVGEVKVLQAEPGEELEPAELALKPGARARMADVLEAEEKLLRFYREKGYPWPKVVQRTVVVDHSNRCVNVEWLVRPGAQARWGAMKIEGLSRVREAFVKGRAPWRIGERWDVRALEEFQTRLSQEGIFSSVSVEPRADPQDPGIAETIVKVRERKRKSVGLAAGYATDRGMGVRASWQHRNLAGFGERLQLQGELAERTWGGALDFRRPQFFVPRQDLLASLEHRQEEAEAYTSRWQRAAIGLEREITRRWRADVEFALRFSQVERDEDRSFSLASVRVRGIRDTTDNFLDPTRGSRLTLAMIPTLDLLREGAGFVRMNGALSGYWQLSQSPSLVLAARVGAGSLVGSSRADVPADELFFAGGGGSIRGYDYQSVGPVDAHGRLQGGRSIFESSLELRWRATRNTGWVIFSDAGTAFERAIPDRHQPIRYSAGTGWRYYFSFGLLRVDAAVPINPPAGQDRDLKLYISIGQSF